MNNVQNAKFNSQGKSEDFLDDNKVELAEIPQIEPLRVLLKANLTTIGTAMALAEQDNTGFTLSKNAAVSNLKRLMLKVGRGATAYYSITKNLNKLAVTDFNKSELDDIIESDLGSIALKLHSEALPDLANLVRVDATDFTDLQAAAMLLIDIMYDPKRAIETSKRYNDSIEGYLKIGDDLRNQIDLYMRTFIDDKPGLYAEWKLSLGIDDLPTHGSPDYSTPVTAVSGGVASTVDYAPLGGLYGSTSLKFTAPPNLPQGLRVGFGTNPQTILPGTEIQLSSGTSNKLTAASLGFDLNTAPFLNIINDTQQPVAVTIEFYLAD